MEATAMKRCTTCGQDRLERVDQEQSVTVAGRTFAGTVRAERCQNCGATFFDAPEVEAFEEAAAYELAKDGPVSGETLRYLRTAGLGMRAGELARLLDVEPETLSRWENGKIAMPRVPWATVAAMVIERREGQSETLDRLRALAEPKTLAKAVRIERRASVGGVGG
jgi:putative zinc finger/helix-turn-helix YgiT family protein